MNLPNKLTLLRVIMIPFFVFFLLINPEITALRIIADLIFIAASLTDMADGKIARKYNLVTNFGKFMDPLADKLLVCSAMICLIQTKQLAAWYVIIIIAREFIISGFRLIAAENGLVIAANIFGKIKTTTQMIMIVILVANLPFGWLTVLGEIFKWVALIMTILSLVIYIYQNIDVLKEQK
ncbi:CDP-diacylglycerol--glycerol-3-phosphate 3-phosphatidyltransferase [Pseudobutyrivibrio sp. 49]|uniref:CDP-diacylglycerol--glycerol-3-phosphate 3-phosphatidyltransferase n=1 Tax=unclassified Pseudobutyrivibrio TaxID=2638619 RepID=UPI0008843B34|nr:MULTISPECIES: CDP-diacylglycerol--glycerol-3-phosphate 3-phosphatidyltransferase [unclassified Pseudobutyrivibrio]SDH45181.1 CDP-diacylglycerol--glycerol-3-phosphate 3-phosphatidyltransferase [Pseudobutyrivibrio sp. 49]SFN43497.1 CDP-diacylglycerol--glycerol-3-phosphate 3-phosphatidyltransferase [Pseudobutyrivibrio sp. UC1225]